jgi:cobalt-zinc-cadmium resistance protein CzcA
MFLSLTLMPALASLMLPRRIEEREPLLMRIVHRIYAPVLRFSMNHKTAVIGFAGCVLFLAFGIIAPNLGSEFVPRLSEGAIAISVVRLTGTDLQDSIQYNTQIEKTVLAEFPDEVEHVWSRIGTAEIATDPMGIELTDTFMTLKPRKLWKRAHTQAELTSLIEKHLRDMPGQRLIYLQPIEMRMNEMVSGVRADVAVKLYGDDLDTLAAKGQEIEAILTRIPGSADVSTEQLTGQPVLQIKLNQEQLARHGVDRQQASGRDN